LSSGATNGNFNEDGFPQQSRQALGSTRCEASSRRDDERPSFKPDFREKRWGQLDLAGNVVEWNLDWFAPYVDPCVDCAYLIATPAAGRVDRGGGCASDLSSLSPQARSGWSLRSSEIGVRCARAP